MVVPVRVACRPKGSATRRGTGRQLSGWLALGVAAGLLAPRAGLAQQRLPGADSVRVRPTYPSLRPLVVQSSLLPARRVATKYEGVDLTTTKAAPGHQLRLLGIAPVLITKRVVLLLGVNYLREQGSYSRPLNKSALKDSSYAYVREDFSCSLTAMRRDSLFRRPITYLVSVTGVSREFGWPEKLTGGVTALLTLHSTPTTKLSVGLTLQLNPSIKVPATPVVSYWHRFGRSAWEVDLVLPGRAHLRRPLLANNCWLSLGTDVLNTHSFGAGIVPGFTSTLETNTVSVQTGALFEYVVNPYFILGMRGGLDTPVSMWVDEKNSSRMVIEAEATSAFYVGLNLSLTVPSRLL